MSMLWGGGALAAWLREGGPPERNGRLASTWRAMAFDTCSGLQSRLPPPPTIERPPIFILGLWRTGTTLLHEMLGALDGMVAPATWQCFRPASLRLVGRPSGDALAIRPMDGVAVTTESPQEDEFALLLMGVPSLYRFFLDPRRVDEILPLLADTGNAAWLPTWEAFCGGVLAATPGRLVVKSPNHLFRSGAIQARFPAAPLVVTLRDPVETYWSNVRTWQALNELHGLWPAPYGAIERFVVAALAAGASVFERLAADRVPVRIVQFEALATDPAKASLALAVQLGLADGQVDARLRRMAADRRHVRPVTLQRPVPAGAKIAVEQLCHAQHVLAQQNACIMDA